jgi:hypothetical protein
MTAWLHQTHSMTRYVCREVSRRWNSFPELLVISWDWSKNLIFNWRRTGDRTCRNMNVLPEWFSNVSCGQQIVSSSDQSLTCDLQVTLTATPTQVPQPSKWTKSWHITSWNAMDYIFSSVRGSLVCWGTMLQAGRSRFRIPMRSLDFSVDLIFSSRTLVVGSTQPLTEMSIRNLPGGIRRPECKTDNLTAICEPTL